MAGLRRRNEQNADAQRHADEVERLRREELAMRHVEKALKRRGSRKANAGSEHGSGRQEGKYFFPWPPLPAVRE